MKMTDASPDCLPGVLSVALAIGALWSSGLRASEATEVMPGAVDLRPRFEQWGLPIRSQGDRGTCSVFAMTGAIEYALASRNGTGTVLSVEFLNWAANQAGHNAGDGGFFSDLWKGFERYGICAETNLPYRSQFDSHLQPEPRVIELAKTALRANLRLQWIKPWDVTTGLTETQFQNIKAILTDGQPVCAGLRWPKHEVWQGKVLQMASPADVFDGHSVLLVGFRDDTTQPGGGVFLVRNSGGGVQDGALPYEYARAYVNDAAWISAKQETKEPLPVRALHLMAPNKNGVAPLCDFIRDSLSEAGVNTLVLEFDYNFDFKSLPEFADASAPDKDDVRKILSACREAGIELIPQMNCLGHQSWARHNGRLLEKHPEFDETQGKYPENEGIYCRSYCPLHPEVHKVLFALMDELAAACEAKAFHIGMDEVFILADPDCPRCKEKDPADLFAGEVRTLHAHLQKIGCRTWMWGDRFLDGKATGLGKWEASENGTQSAIDHVPKDIIICDWHYDRSPDTPRLFAEKGFDVVVCPWRKTDVALAELEEVKKIRVNSDPSVARHALGIMQTTWCDASQFAEAYRAESTGSPPANNSASESAHCFATLFEAMRKQ